MPSTRLTREERLRRVRDYLATRDIPCPKCRYNLRGLENPQCPECGFGFDDVTIRLLAPLNRRASIRVLHSELLFWVAAGINTLVAVAVLYRYTGYTSRTMEPILWCNRTLVLLGVLSLIETLLPGSVRLAADTWEIFVEYGTTVYILLSLVTCAVLVASMLL